MTLIYTKIKWFESKPGFPSSAIIKCTDDEKINISSILCDSSEPKIHLDNLRTELVTILEERYANPAFECNSIIDFKCNIDLEPGEVCRIACALLDNSKIKLKNQEPKEDNNCVFRLEE